MGDLVDALKSSFEPRIRSRGNAYYSQGRVRGVFVEEGEATANVRGTHVYRVAVVSNAEGIHVDCDCPFFDGGGACKHLWAFVRHLDDKDLVPVRGPSKIAASLGDADDDDDLIASPGVSLQGVQAPTWKTALDRASTGMETYRPSPPREMQIGYLLDIDQMRWSGHLILLVHHQVRLQGGGWGKMKPLQLREAQLPLLDNEADREILTLLHGATEPHEPFGAFSRDGNKIPAEFKLPRNFQSIVFPYLCRSERFFLQMPEGDHLGPLKWDGETEYTFRMQIKKAKKDFEVTGALVTADDEVSMHDPLFMHSHGWVFFADRIARLANPEHFSWNETLHSLKSVSLPKEDVDEFFAGLFRSETLPPMDLPKDLDFPRRDAKPEGVVLKVKSPDERSHSHLLRASVDFLYESVAIPWDDPRAGFLVEQDAQKCFLNRDRDAEQEMASRLERMGLKKENGFPEHEMPFPWTLRPGLLDPLVSEINKLGWNVEVDGKQIRQPGSFELNVSSGIDWFELHGGCNFDGQQANLPALLKALKKGERTILLDDGSHGMLPEEWLKKYSLLAGMGEMKDDHIRFKTSQAGLLDLLLAEQPETSFDESFALARSELTKFTSVQVAKATSGFKGTLRGYQEEGLGWLQFLNQFGVGGCLADDMGLGKTIQVLALLTWRRDAEHRKKNKPCFLVVAPRSLVFNWKLEAERFTPGLKVHVHEGQQRVRDASGFEGHDLIITTYGLVRRDIAWLRDITFDYAVLDEAQAIKNAHSQSAKACRLLKATHRLSLSGTPIENHLGELWSQFEFLNPGYLGASTGFNRVMTGPSTPERDGHAQLLARAVKPFLLRRTKAEVASDLPEKIEETIYCEFDEPQRKLYNETRDYYRQALLTKESEDGLNRMKIQVLEALLRLRQIACHPGLIDPKKASAGSAKLDFLYPQIEQVMEEGHKVLVFSQFVSFLSILREEFDKEGVRYAYLDGRTKDRQAQVDEFQTDPDCKLFLISLKAGGLGLNLTAAEYIFLLDPWWNPAVEAQAIDRAHRIGQTQKVFAYRLIVRDSIEEKVLQLQESKRQLADAIIKADNSLIRDLSREDLELLLT